MAYLVEASQFLHGVLDLTIFEADHLHHCFHGFLLQVTEKIEEALHLDKLAHTKLYATVDIGGARVARTREIEFHPKNPIWNESFHICCAYSAPSIVISIKNQLPVDAKVLGRAKIPTSQLLTGQPLEGWFDLFDDEGHKLKKAKIHVLLKFSDITSDPCWNAGIRLPQFSGLPKVYFPQKTGCEVTLYQNSHLSNNFRPVIHLSDGKNYHPPRLWEDLYIAITEAKHFIYVAGWSVNVNITLIRDPERMIPGAEGVTIGELLKKKAEEGVTVLVMVWKDRTSVSLLGNAGLMNTHDEETYEFFQGSMVKCFLCPRNADPSLTAVQHVEIGMEFTHHQKAVCLDAPMSNGTSRIVSFVGGIDLCGGRYDDENHTLFRNLDTTYVDDFQQHNFPHADLRHGGPREPWHDVHSKLEGLAAWDVLTNFEQRWIKQSPKEISHCLVKIHERPDIFPIPSGLATQESWNVQVFRSIDDASVVGFPSDPSEAAELGLMSAKDVTVDQSIHSGYVEAIRRAKRFIYIENQYFFGSCASWREEQDCGCLNLIPIEIALKIASKIRLGERFAAYIVTPMWPEGIPEGDTVQAILHWNRLTMEMMYGIVARAIEEAGLGGKAHPCDYLNFFCLGNREVRYPGEYIPPERPEPGSDYWKAQVNRRFLIYVHAKLMIVDDEYVIIGSANLNQRSLAGDRDSEIAHGAYQPAHLNRPDAPARGLIYGYRMSLWYEHFMSHHRHLSPVFLEPESLKCVRTVKRIAEDLWEKFVGDEVINLPGHLLPFPIQVSEFGELSELPPDGFFPDTKAPVKGKKSEILPPILTT
ncbi:phospholipase D alpha 1-like [Phoenix dactylifera]|uniref:Phospholipase D n=1 Tax=Phoenix dactylifera TaxID=42345 RepID=A0A8B9A9M1_PHODC|nr:phospholipase D alpha 1-like [Phoenix dactylifera]XP_038982406.1 phospholipase D alpha 1-like [Phoenix dactylifera]XP_038982407.1 phospholipase D alpha 1-like [Phoenix dactylifera]XP_038982413.1 phospholipase D alpha 1-like [Phoenix dactylifera]